MERARRIWAGVLGGVVFVSAAGGTFWWLQSRTAEEAVVPEIPLVQTPEDSTPPAPAAPVSTTPQPTPPTSTWALVPLPAGSVKIERGQSDVKMTEPGLVRFDVKTGESTVWHWSRSVAKYGAVPAGDWAVVTKGESNLAIHLPTGDAYRLAGRLLWHGKEGALIQVTEGSRQRLILTDASFKVQSERWLPDGLGDLLYWKRGESGWFYFDARMQGASAARHYRFSMLTGAIEEAVPPAPSGLWLEQVSITPAGCGSDGGGNLVKLRQGNQVLWTVIDAIAPGDYTYGGSRILADRSGALVDTLEGPSVLHVADGRLQAAPELKALGTPYFFASPTDPKAVAGVPLYRDGSYLLRVQQLGQATPPQRFQLNATTSEKDVDVSVEAPTYWSEDGRYLQLTVHYPEAGGRCGAGDDTSTLLAPVVAKGDWKGPYQIQTKEGTSLYAAKQQNESWTMGSVLRTVSAGERFTVKAISLYPKKLFVVTLPEGEGILLADPAQLEWVR